jgi:hypothetical protein
MHFPTVAALFFSALTVTAQTSGPETTDAATANELLQELAN